MGKGDNVILKTFHGLKHSETQVNTEDDYWKLIGKKGVIISDIKSPHPSFQEKGERVLVAFEDNLSELGLNNHNEHDNSLWIFLSDLEDT